MKDFQVKLHIDTTVQPTCQPHRRVPFHIRQRVEQELQKLEASDIIETVSGPTPWVSPIVTPPKPKNPSEVRIWVDMRQANTAIQRERHITPTMDDIIHELNGTTVFSKLDLRAGYHQLELHPDSRYITTFSTHKGLRRYKRLNFGISSAAEVFQNAICQTLQGIDGVKNLSDDIIVHGKTQADHDRSLAAVFQRLKDKGLTLNKEKCEFNKSRLEFFGFIFQAGGISADPKKVAAIKEASAPDNPTEVRSLLGMATYCARFIKDFASISAPLRELTKKGTPWQWRPEHDTALQALKDSLTSETVMSYFDPDKQSELVVDASPVGLGAILYQLGKEGERHTIAYASRALSDVERRYSQTEREALAIIWSCEHFHLYLYGHSFTLVTDHKALEIIWNNPRSKPPARIERWGLRLQPYNFRVVYRKGTENPADYMSRHPVQTENGQHTRATKVAEEYVNFLAQHATPKAMTLNEIKEATLKDPVLQKVSDHIRNNTWHLITKETQYGIALQKYKQISSELTVSHTDDVLLRGSRIIIPSALEDNELQLAHKGRQGIVKTKTLLRSKVWFPNIDQKAELIVKNCLACQANTPVTPLEPLRMSKLPETPWHTVSADFYGPLPTGEYLLVVIDEYTRYPVVEVVRSTAASVIIPIVDKIFSMFGIPRVFKTDNGPPFNSEKFSMFLTHMGCQHRKITPLWPQANATAERFMRTLGKATRVSESQSIPWKQTLNTFLREYRSTPHSTTEASPAELMFSRKIYTKIPTLSSVNKDTDHVIRKRDRHAKTRMKENADARHHARPSFLAIGDKVLYRQPRHNKLTPSYNCNPHTVTHINGSMVTASNEGHSITRNSSFFKKINVNTQHSTQCAGNDDEDITVVAQRYPRRQCRRPAYLNNYDDSG